MNFSSRHNIFSWSQKEGGTREGANIRGNTVYGVDMQGTYGNIHTKYEVSMCIVYIEDDNGNDAHINTNNDT